MMAYAILIHALRGIVSTVAHRSPKPSVRVRILLPLPSRKQTGTLSFSFFIVKKVLPFKETLIN